MTVDECISILTPLALALRAQIDAPTYLAYHSLLKDIPAGLVAAGIDHLRQTGGLEFFPSAPKLQAAAEWARRQQLALEAWTPCAECEGWPGMREVVDDTGTRRMSPCPCKARHRSRLADRGLLEPIAVLSGETPGGSDQVFPRLEDLPASLRKQVQQAAAQKVLR